MCTSGGGGGSYFPYILLNEIETMFSQLAKQSHWKLSADSSIAHKHILPVNKSTRFPTETEKMAVEGKSLPLLLVSYFLLRKKFSHLKWTLNLDNCMCEHSVAVETRFLLWKPDRLLFVMSHRNKLLYMCISHSLHKVAI